MQYRLPDLQDKIKNDINIGAFINAKYLNCQSEEEILHILNILNLVIINSVFNIFVKQSPIEKERQSFLLNKIKDRQVFITCCDYSTESLLESGRIFLVENGNVIEK